MDKKNLNNIVQEKLRKIEDNLVPGTSWDKSASWKKIREILDTKNKKMVIWYFATAASVSFAFAATLNENLNFFKDSIDQLIPAPLVEDAPALKKNDTLEFKDTRVQHMEDEIESKSISSVLTEIEQQKVPEYHYYEPELTNSVKKNEPTQKLQVAPSVYFSGFQSGSINQPFTPGASIDLRYNLKKNNYISIGLQTTLFTKNHQERSVEAYPATFVNTKYGKSTINKRGKNKIWEVGAGYLINPDHQIFDDSTFRFQYNRTIVGRLRGGPEVIFTNNFRKVYPGFTIVFS